MKKIITLFFITCTFIIDAQNPIEETINSRLVDLHEVGDNNENFEGFERLKNEIGDAHIVMLGEQSHSDATTFETKIKLIKYLHQEMDFDILAFESSIYDCDKAWSMIQQGHDVKDALAKGIFDIWSVLEIFNSLYQYFELQLELENPLMIAGFDPQINAKLAADYFDKDLTAFLATFEDASLYEKEIEQLQLFINKSRKGKKISKKKAVQNIAFLQKMIKEISNKQNTERSNLWVQSLKSMEVFISDTNLKTNHRDRQMADNLIWLKEKYPNKKIICWGATSHFLYNSSSIRLQDKKMQKAVGDYYQNTSMMGDYIKEKYGDEVYTIGFVAHEGSFGYNRNRTIDLPAKKSLEYLIGQSENDNYFLSFKNISLEGYLSRPLAHQNMTSDITKVMDGVVFNRYMSRPYTDWEFLFYIVPENSMWKKKKERFIRESKMRKEKEKNKKIKEEQERIKRAQSMRWQNEMSTG